MLNALETTQSKLSHLYTLAAQLAAFESSGLKTELESFQNKLTQCSESGQTVNATQSIERILSTAISQVESWVTTEKAEGIVSPAQIKSLIDNLSSASRWLKVKPKSLSHAAEADQKYANDDIERNRTQSSSVVTQPEIYTTSSESFFELKTEVQTQDDLTTLKGQLGAIEVKLLQASQSFKETEASAIRNSNRIKNFRAHISKLKPGTDAMDNELSRLEEMMDEINPILEKMPDSPQSSVDIDASASFRGAAFLQAMQSRAGLQGFYTSTQTTPHTREVNKLKTEITQLKTQAKALQAENKKLLKEKAELVDDLADELTAGETLQKTLDQKLADHHTHQKSLQEKLDHVKLQYTESESARKSAMATIKEYEVEYPEALAEAEEKVKTAEANLSQNKAELEQLQNTLSELKTKIAVLSERNALLEHETLFGHFKTEATEKIIECDRLKKQIAQQKAEYKAEVHTLLDEINRLQKILNNYKALDRNNDNQNLKIEALEQEIKRLHGLRILDTRPMGKDNKMTPDAVMLKQAEEQVDGLSNANTVLQSRLSAAQARIQELEKAQKVQDKQFLTSKAQTAEEPIKPKKLDAVDGIRIATGVAGTVLCVFAAVATGLALFTAWPLAVAGVVIGACGYLVWNHKNSKNEDQNSEINHPAPQSRDALVVKPAIEKKVPVSAPRMLTV